MNRNLPLYFKELAFNETTLLPRNESNELKKIDIATRKSIFDNAMLIDINPLSCSPVLLPTLAQSAQVLFWDSSIMNEEQKREMINKSTQTHRHIGTPYAVKTAFEVIGFSVEVLEWFETKSEPYTFKVQIFLTDDLTQVINEDNFNKYGEIIDRVKNVRSRFESFIIQIPTITAEVKVSSGSESLKIRPFMNINELIINNDISVHNGWHYDVTAKSSINESIALSEINIKGGYRWQVEV